ncbi:MAG TPA: sulfatase-like hydrolase/transferase [Terriglobia bacterium]|nr:sulfatase-like hydrolase/transferase [Terriglobia bacterium]
MEVRKGPRRSGIATLSAALIAFVVLVLNSAAKEQSHVNVVLITIDTLRADHLGCYGYGSIQTPNIDRLAREGVRFTQAYTPVPITLPAHAALMTGEFPLATGIHDFSGNRLPPNIVTLAKTLRDHGYTTAAFIGSAVLDSRFGLKQGFETYFDHFDFGRSEEVHLDTVERRGDRVVDEALKWLKLDSKLPFFLWVHLYDPHAPYNPPEPYASRYRARPYDGEIAFADAQVGRLLGFLTERRLLENCLIVLASDHGESLGEHGEKTHGFFIYNSTLHVPLIVKIPRGVPRVVSDEVSLVDVMPTILQDLNLPIPAGVQGRSLLSQVLGRPTENASTLYAESYPPLLHFGWNSLQGVQWRGLKYIQTTRPELYDTRTDPRELHNLLSERRALGQEMSERLEGMVRRFTPSTGASAAEEELTDPALLESLRSLGYVAVSAGNVKNTSDRSLPDPKDRIQVYELVSAALTDDQQSHYEESLHKLHEAEKTEPGLLTIRFLMARDYLHLNDFPHAIEYFQSVLKQEPKYAVAAYYLGLAQLEAGDLNAAEDSFRTALSLDPTNFSAAFNLGVVYSRQHRADPAIQAFQRAVEILPDYAEAHEALGELYLYLKRPEDAVRELEKAAAIDPKMAKAHYQLGRAYTVLGLQERARQEFDRAKPQ